MSTLDVNSHIGLSTKGIVWHTILYARTHARTRLLPRANPNHWAHGIPLVYSFTARGQSAFVALWRPSPLGPLRQPRATRDTCNGLAAECVSLQPIDACSDPAPPIWLLAAGCWLLVALTLALVPRDDDLRHTQSVTQSGCSSFRSPREFGSLLPAFEGALPFASSSRLGWSFCDSVTCALRRGPAVANTSHQE